MADKKKVLLVDDDPDFVEAIKVIVENGGYDVRVAYDGAEGLEAVAKDKPEAILKHAIDPRYGLLPEHTAEDARAMRASGAP